MGGNELRRFNTEMDRNGGWEKGGVCVCVLRATVVKSVEYEDDFYHQICFDQCKERYH